MGIRRPGLLCQSLPPERVTGWGGGGDSGMENSFAGCRACPLPSRLQLPKKQGGGALAAQVTLAGFHTANPSRPRPAARASGATCTLLATGPAEALASKLVLEPQRC